MITASSPAAPTPFRRALALAFIAALTAPLGAQTAPVASNATPAAAQAPTAPTDETKGLNLVVETVYEHIFSADLNSGATGSMSINRFAIGAQGTEDWDADHLTIGAGYVYLNYDFSGSGAPFGNVQKLGANVLYSHDFNPDWGAFAYLSSAMSAETAVSLDNGRQIAVAAGPTYNISKVLSVSAGPMYYSRLEDADTVTLMAMAKWNFLPRWELRGYAGISNGATLSYDVFGNRATVVDASLDYNSRWFRTRDTATGKQAVNESDATLKFGVRQALSENFFVRGYVSYIFSREYQFHVNGNSANSFNVDSSWGIGLEIGAAF